MRGRLLAEFASRAEFRPGQLGPNYFMITYNSQTITRNPAESETFHLGSSIRAKSSTGMIFPCNHKFNFQGLVRNPGRKFQLG